MGLRASKGDDTHRYRLPAKGQSLCFHDCLTSLFGLRPQHLLLGFDLSSFPDSLFAQRMRPQPGANVAEILSRPSTIANGL